MIRINLLPSELRRGNRLPPRVLAAAFGAALLSSAAVGWLGLVYFGDLARAEQDLQAASAQLRARAPKVAYHDALVKNQEDYALRVQTIQEIGNGRRTWTRFMDDLIDVVSSSGPGERHLAWFDSISVTGDPRTGSTLKTSGNVQGAASDRVANFHEDLAAAKFAEQVERKSDPVWSLEEDEDRIPAAYLRFPVDMQFRPTVTKKK